MNYLPRLTPRSPLAWTFPLIFVTAGCGATLPQLREQASQDLNCPESEVDLQTGDSGTMWATCFGAEAAYKSSCEGEGGCVWERQPDKATAEE